LNDLMEEQIRLEIKMKTSGIDRWNKNNERFLKAGQVSETSWNKRIIKESIYPLSRAIEEYIHYYGNRAGKPVKALAYIKLLPPETAAFITIKTMLNESCKEINLESIIDSIGQRIEDQVRFEKLEDKAEKYVAKVKERLARAVSKNYVHQKNALVAGEKTLSEPKSEDYEPLERWINWGVDAQRHIGAALINMAIENVLFNGSALFEKKNFYVKMGKTFKEVIRLKVSDEIVGWIDRYREVMEAQSPAYRPCIIPPRDWTNPYTGGYYILDTITMVKGRKSQLKRLTKTQMPLVYRAINGLQNVPWQISKDVLEIAKSILKTGNGLAMPQREPFSKPACPVPPELSEIRGKELKTYLTKDQWSDFISWRQETTEIYQKDNKRKAKYLNFFNTVSTATDYSQYDRFFFVYTCDSRGRYYAESSTINPQGDDFQRGLLKFADPMPLGEDGVYWLAVHGAGKWGNDKIPFDERVTFIKRMTDDIRDFVADPLSNTGWASADKPWQFLNWCFEWSKLQDWIEEGNKEEDFLSYIGPAQDGSCSGLQHYSAMLKDLIGGTAVNLVPMDTPQDIYQKVANLTKLKLEKIAETSESEKDKELAKGLLTIKGGINRKLTKPPVMTKTYGSTLIRCLKTTSSYFSELQSKEEKEAKAENRKPVRVHPFPMSSKDGINIKEAEKLCANVIWQALKETVTSAIDGMYFIQKIAWDLARGGCHLEWETPTGFIVEQREYEFKTRRIKTQLLGNTRFTIAEETNKLDPYSMKTASAPNFVHSMDASHLTLVVNAMLDAGITNMAVVHDDFAAHACYTKLLRKMLSETFVRMYSDHNVLEEFKEHLEALILTEIDIPLPEMGDLDLSWILKSEYAFG
jgi:DNA-directed RNA polymerase